MTTALIKRVLQRLALAADCELTPRWRLANQPLARHLSTLFALHGVDVVLDVGANRGQYRDLLRDEVGYSGHIVSFEPIRAHAQALQERARHDQHWQVYDCALGREPGELPLNVMLDDSLSSFRQPSTAATSYLADVNTLAEVQMAPVRRLDDVWPEIARLGVMRAYLKMDTQGFDSEVVAGGTATLARVVGLQTEVAMKPLYVGVPRYTESIQTLEALGFEPSALFAVSHDDALRLVECDCVMVKRDL